MRFSFDLISDLHIETWGDFDWTGQATSPFCVVAGDISQDIEIVKETLEHLGQCYQGVFYIDGNDEHRFYLDDTTESYQLLEDTIKNIPRVVYLQDNVAIINGVAILATNGWWSYDMDPTIDYDQVQMWYNHRMNTLPSTPDNITALAFNDANYLKRSIKRLQTHRDVKSIVIVSHTVPMPDIINHDPELIGTHRFNCMGNQYLKLALDEDSENKVSVWAFGHYHKPVDRIINNVRFVNNCRGRGGTDWCQVAYYPKKITIDY